MGAFFSGNNCCKRKEIKCFKKKFKVMIIISSIG